MKCQDFRELIDSYLSDELLTETNHDVLRHLEQCAACRKTIESRRIFRTKLRSAVTNASEFQMRENFYAELRGDLKRNFLPKNQEKQTFWTDTNSWIAVAACLLVAFGFGVWFFQNSNVNSVLPEIVSVTENNQPAYVGKIALGDHLNCAVDFSLPENPVDIDLASAEYADLRQGVLKPLENASGKYEFVESHTCEYQDRDFTHIVFRHEGRLLSVLMTNLQNYNSTQNGNIAKSAENGYQIAHFDVSDKAFFVISDLSERENSAAAEILQNPLQKQFSDVRQASFISRARFKH